MWLYSACPWRLLVVRVRPVDQAACGTREEAPVILSEADSLLTPIAEIEGFLLGCLIDASTGMVVASQPEQEQEQGAINLPAAAAGAADIANVLALLKGQLATDGLEDVMVTFHNHFHVIRLVRQNVEPQILLLVVLDRVRANLAMARREIRNFCSTFAP
jgi:hypothetical protein